MAEFQVTTDLAPIRQLVIEANFAEMEQAVQTMMEPYRNMIVTADGLATARADRARINKVAARIDEVRKTVKAEMSAPIAEFERKCNAIKQIAVEAGANLDTQIKGFEDRAVTEKIDFLRAFWEEKASIDDREFAPFERIAAENPKWKNKTYSMDAAQNDIMRTMASVKAGLSAIRNYPETYREALLEKFRETGSLQDTITLYEQIKRRAEAEQARREAEERRAAYVKQMELAKARGAEIAAPDAEEEIATAQAPRNENETEKPVKVIDFRVWVTAEQMNALGAFLRENGIKYGRVPK